jgi:hypothetical protein
MSQHVDVYALIAKTSSVLKQAMRQEKKGKYPDSIMSVQAEMAGKNSYTDMIAFMQQTIRKYE